MTELPTTRRGLAATGNSGGSETGYPYAGSQRPENKLPFAGGLEVSWPGAVSVSISSQTPEPAKRKTGYVPTEEYRQVPSPMTFPATDVQEQAPKDRARNLETKK